MKKILIAAFIFMGCIPINKVHGYDQVVVTDINFLNRFDPGMNYFESYFDTVINKSLFNIIQEQCMSQFGTQGVDIIPRSIHYKHGILKARLSTPAPTLADKKIVYVSVETIVQSRFSLRSEAYKWITIITTKNKDGSKISKTKYTVPFNSLEPETITEPELMSYTDFTALYRESIINAFAGESKSKTTKNYMKPATRFYDDFMVTTDKYYLFKNRKSYVLEHDDGTYQMNMDTDFKFFSDKFGGFTINKMFNRDVVKKKYTIHNRQTQQEYTVKAQASNNEFLNFINISSELEVLFHRKKDTIGGAVLINPEHLSAQMHQDRFGIYWEPYFDIHEIHRNDTLIALVKERKKKNILFTPRHIQELELEQIMNMIFAYDIALEIYWELEDSKEADE